MVHFTDQATLPQKQNARLKQRQTTSPETSSAEETMRDATATPNNDMNDEVIHGHHRPHPQPHLVDAAMSTSSLGPPGPLTATPPVTEADVPAAETATMPHADRTAQLYRPLSLTGSPSHTSSSPPCRAMAETMPMTHTESPAESYPPHIPTGSRTHTPSIAATGAPPTERGALAGPGLPRSNTLTSSELKGPPEPAGVLQQKRSGSDVEGGHNEDGSHGEVMAQTRSRKKLKVEMMYDCHGMPQLRHALTAAAAMKSTDKETTSEIPSGPTVVAYQAQQDNEAALTDQAGNSLPDTPISAMQLSYQPARKTFSLLGAFVEDSSLIIELVSYLTVPALLSWYAIDRKFHWYYNKNCTAFMLASVRTWAPGADSIYPWRFYQHLCLKDPTKRQKEKSDHLGPEIFKLNLFSRDCPSMRWLQMVVWREGVVTDMVIQLMIKGLRVPPGTIDAVKVRQADMEIDRFLAN